MISLVYAISLTLFVTTLVGWAILLATGKIGTVLYRLLDRLNDISFGALVAAILISM